MWPFVATPPVRHHFPLICVVDTDLFFCAFLERRSLSSGGAFVGCEWEEEEGDT